MSKGRSVTKKAVRLPAGIGIGVAVALAITMLGAVIVTFMLAGENLAVGSATFAIIPVQFLAALCGSTAATMCIGKHKMQVSLITAGMYLLSLLASNAIFFEGEYVGVGGSILVVALAGVAAAFIGNGGAKSLKGKHKFNLNGKIAQFKGLGK